MSVGVEALINALLPELNIHPTWGCKRGGCKGALTLLGPVASHLTDPREARARAALKRQQYPATYTHGSPLSCSECGASRASAQASVVVFLSCDTAGPTLVPCTVIWPSAQTPTDTMLLAFYRDAATRITTNTTVNTTMTPSHNLRAGSQIVCAFERQGQRL